MDTLNSLLRIIAFILPALLIAYLLRRLMQKQARLAKEMGENAFAPEIGFRHAVDAQAVVIRKSEKIAPNAGGYAKVDLLLEVHLPDKPTYQLSTSWLVQVSSLEQVATGKELPVRVDSKRPKRLIPNVPWARAWIFD